MSSKSDSKKLNMSLQFLGAASGIVTGSNTLATITQGDKTTNILVDCGLFQGEHEDYNYELFTDPNLHIDAVLITHAHFDHIGALPLLCKAREGCKPFDGLIYASMETMNEGCYILRDAAKINQQKLNQYSGQLEKVKQQIAKNQERAVQVPTRLGELRELEKAFSIVEEVEQRALYTPDDAEDAISHFEPIYFSPQDEKKTVQIAEGIEATFIPTNHINGSTMIELTARYEGEEKSVLFTGDIANSETYLYRSRTLQKNDKVTAVVMEGLHGCEERQEMMYESYKILQRIIKQAKNSKNKMNKKMVIIPTFSLDRSATIIAMLKHMMKKIGKFTIYIDSPLTECEFMCYKYNYESLQSAWFDYDKESPFDLEGIYVIEKYGEHMEMTREKDFYVIITSSGMGNGGRILDYFRSKVQTDDAIFVFPGYLVDECPSRILVEAERGKIVELNGQKYVKQCQTVQLHGLSSHGYMAEKWDILDAYPSVDTVFLNHGDPDSIEAIRNEITEGTNGEITVFTPDLGDCYNLT